MNKTANPDELEPRPRLAELAEERIGKVESALQDGIENSTEKLRDTLHGAEAMEAELRDNAEQLVRNVGDYIHRNPLQSAGFAFAAGVLTAMLLGRR